MDICINYSLGSCHGVHGFDFTQPFLEKILRVADVRWEVRPTGLATSGRISGTHNYWYEMVILFLFYGYRSAHSLTFCVCLSHRMNGSQRCLVLDSLHVYGR